MSDKESSLTPFKSMSKFRHLNYDTDRDTFMPESDDSTSIPSHEMCAIEEISDSDPTEHSTNVEGIKQIPINASLLRANDDSLIGDFGDEKHFPSQITINQSMSPLPQLTQYDTPNTKHEKASRIISQNCKGTFPKDTLPHIHNVPSIKVRDNVYNAQLLNRAIFNPSPARTTVSS